MAQEYGWQDISVVVFGRTIEGIIDIKYKPTTELEYQRGRGAEPQAILSGNKSVEGTITLLQSELRAINQAIQAVRPGQTIQDISFDAIVNYENESGLATTDSVLGIRVKDYEKGMAQGDKQMKIALAFMAIKVVEDI